MTREWSNKSFGVDGLALYAARGDYVVTLDHIEHFDAIRCASQVQWAPLADIESAFRIAFNRAGLSQPDWDRLRVRMRVWRTAWPVIAEACRRAIAGEDENEFG